ncbi:MAG: hypothetical protein EP343_13510 [Deltaproteobacteria bacterium]|nr:MAG: hypothetical protein EP343_13510 [Deltaproteobacteria bacterium]
MLSMLLPGILFGAGLLWLHSHEPRFAWVLSLQKAPWEFWALMCCGVVATVGGIGDWVYHRVYVSVGPKEHKSHLLALVTGGLPLFVLMAMASLSKHPIVYLVPVVVVVLYTTALICYDEFVFHRKRCLPLETLFHRLLVFGNGLAWLAWFHWCFVRPSLVG